MILRSLATLLLCGVAGCAGAAARVESASAESQSLLVRARQIHREVPLIDGHNDLPWQLRTKGASDFARMDFRGPLPSLHTDIPRLRAGGVGGVFFAAYTPYSAAERGIAARFTLEQIDLIHRMIEHAPELEFAGSAEDVERIHRDGKIAAMIGIEGGHAIENSLPLLRQFYALGVRYMTLTHSDTIDWADACPPAQPRHGGLAAFGEEVVREMNRLGMLVDLSHVSDDTMRDVLEISDAPVIFSHSSARALAIDQSRNVPDDVLKMVHSNGGVVMVNFFSGYLSAEPADRREKATDARKRIETQFPEEERRAEWRKWMRENPMPRGDVGTVADHIDHICKVAGIDHVGLGSDFDGVPVLPEGLEDVSCYLNLTAELLRRGYSDGDVKKILGLNVMRVMRQAEEISRQIQKQRPPSLATTQPSTLLKDLRSADLPTSRPGAAR
ncbi:MAG: rane dipeptidase [Phycisphaerales bacterium]|jgi:membrane dipeptidase|nr:rane dipeptidase [Phycisphaerales bacterium]